MAPAQQCLDADQLALHVDQRLVVQLQLLAGQRIAQVAQQQNAAGDILLQARLEQAQAVAPGFLGPVQRHVGLLDQLFLRFAERMQ